MARKEFPKSVKVAALKRCQISDGLFACEVCGVAMKAGRIEFDHRIADGLGGEPTLENCVAACTDCHSQKTASNDVPAIARAKRREAKNLGIKTNKRPWPKPIDPWNRWRSGS
jgi:5-methylcytosine-specific restriction endonuclease McrA